MSKGGIIKKSYEASDVEPFSFENFDESVSQGRDLVQVEPTEEKSEGEERSDSVRTDLSNEVRMELLQPPDIEELVIKRLSEVEREAQEIKNRAFEEGRAEGYQVGYEQGMEDAREIARQCGETLKSLSNLPYSIMNDYKEWLIEAAFTIAKHIIQGELTTKPQALLGFIGRLAKEMEDNVPITVFLNPEDLSLLRIGSDFDEWARTQGKALRLAEDPALERGSCRLESDLALLDATLSKLLEEMKREIFIESAR
ncbi:MAG: FliH/SctL family protein [Thermodesulforhabdaceae bacterium]